MLEHTIMNKWWLFLEEERHIQNILRQKQKKKKDFSTNLWRYVLYKSIGMFTYRYVTTEYDMLLTNSLMQVDVVC